jgi:hypothetical protein
MLSLDVYLELDLIVVFSFLTDKLVVKSNNPFSNETHHYDTTESGVKHPELNNQKTRLTVNILFLLGNKHGK